MKKVFVVLMMGVLLLSACQPTPNKPVIANKGNNELSKVTTAAQGQNQFKDLPDKVQMSFTDKNNKITVNVDAKPTVPDTGKVAIAKLVPRKFTQDEMDKVIKALMQNKALYKPRELEDLTKKEIMDKIVRLKSGKDSDLYEADPEAYKKEIQTDLKMYEELLKKAPDVYTKKPADTKIMQSEKGWLKVYVEADLGKSKLADFNYGDKDTRIVEFSFNNITGNTPPFGKVTAKLANVPGVTIPVEKAQKMAEETVNNLGLGDFALNGLGTIPYWGKLNEEDADNYDEMEKCYIFFFTRKTNGINETYVNEEYIRGTSIPTQTKQYNYVWPCEVIKVTVNNEGVLSVNYTGPIPNIQVINENAKIKSFEEIKSIFQSQIMQAAIPRDKNIVGTTININEIVFGLTKIIDKDNNGGYLYVPTWDFFGSATSKYKAGTGDQAQLDKNNSFTESDYRSSIMTINAVDGSVIHRDQGY